MDMREKFYKKAAMQKTPESLTQAFFVFLKDPCAYNYQTLTDVFGRKLTLLGKNFTWYRTQHIDPELQIDAVVDEILYSLHKKYRESSSSYSLVHGSLKRLRRKHRKHIKWRKECQAAVDMVEHRIPPLYWEHRVEASLDFGKNFGWIDEVNFILLLAISDGYTAKEAAYLFHRTGTWAESRIRAVRKQFQKGPKKKDPRGRPSRDVSPGEVRAALSRFLNN